MKFLFHSSYAHLALRPDANSVSGGAELQLAMLAQELVKRGHKVVIVGCSEEIEDGAVWEGIKVRDGGAYQTGGLVDTLKSLPHTAQILREERPDYVGIMGAGSWVFFLWLLKFTHPYKLVFISGSDIDVDGSYRRMNPAKGALHEFALRRADIRFAMTDDQAAAYKRASLSCHLYRNLLPILPESSHPAKEIDFLWVSSAQPLKRPHLFLELAKKMPQHSFTMICPPKHDRAFWESVRDAAASIPNVQFIEWVAYHNIQPYFDRAQIFVNSSEYEGFPNTFVQSGLGATAVLSLLVNPDRYITRYGAGICAEGDLERFYHEAQRMIGDGTLLANMQKRSADFVSENHNNERNAEAFLAGLEVR